MEDITDYITHAASAVSFLEFIAVLLGIVYIYFAANNQIWCWPAALVSVSIYIYLCLKAQLYAETFLQFYYWIMAIYGWWMWTKNSKQDKELSISEWSTKTHLIIIFGGILAVVLIANFLSHFTDAAMPYLDSFTTVFSLITTVMVARKVLSNWIYWFIIDAAAVYLYASRELYLTALLFLAYCVIVVFGYLKWKKIYIAQNV